MHESTSDILLRCEQDHSAPPYVVAPGTYREGKGSFLRRSLPLPVPPVPLPTGGDDVFVVSDLHIAAGRNAAGTFRGTENFFADDSFARFLEHALEVKKSSAAILILNGDLFDFLRVTEYPGKTAAPRLTTKIRDALKRRPLEAGSRPTGDDADTFARWSSALGRVGIGRTPGELEVSISDRERTYGLGTEEFKSVYKLMRIQTGHPVFFAALSRWMEGGHRIVVVKGNHDLEWYWLGVRNYFRLAIADGIAARAKRRDINGVLKKTVLPNITFIDDALLVDRTIYLEHGHRYDRFSMVLDGPTLPRNPRQINIPFGSFFNRYLINRIELFYPFLDNVRPGTNLLPVLVRENFPLALRVLFQHIPFMIRVLSTRPRYVWFMFHSVFWTLLALAVPLLVPLIFAPGILADVSGSIGTGGGTGIAGAIITAGRNVGLLILSYLLARFVAWYQLEEPSSLEPYAAVRAAGAGFAIMAMGHTHNPGESLLEGGCRFYNTGTWIPIIESSSAAVREDRTYTFLHITREKGGAPRAEGGMLQRWNDDALRGEPLVVVDRT